MVVSSEIITEEEVITDSLYVHNEKEYPYIVNRISDICLAKFVELVFRDKFGNPLLLLPFQRVMLQMMWHKKFPMVLACRGGGKTFMIAVYCLLKCLLIPGTQIVIVSGGFRQAKFTFQYMDMLLKNSPILQEAIRKFHPGNEFGVKFATDKVYLKVGNNTDITGIPIGDGTKVRGMRATTLICDEVASIDDKVFDTAIGPFLSVQADPAEAVIVEEFLDRLRAMNANQSVIKMIEGARRNQGNQLVLMGTATYQFNHFYRRYTAYLTFARSGGDRKLIKEGLQLQAGEEAGITITNEMLDLWEEIYKEYAIFQLPYDQMPKGFLDAPVVATHKAMMPPVIFGHEYECKFSKDTNGFFPRSLIEEASPGLSEVQAGGFEVHYELYGDPNAQYVMGLDPARWNDNFGLVVLKLTPDGAQVVYVDSWNKAKWQDSIKKIRDVLRRFPNTIYIACDKGGGGDTVQELLANAKMLKEDEKPIIEIDPSDEYKAIPNALRILEMVNFHTWAAPANHAMKSDIILKRLLFPGRLDEDEVFEQQAKRVKADGTPFDTDDPEDIEWLEYLTDLLHGTENDQGDILTFGAYKEMGLLVDELCTIVQTVTEKGTEQFGLPKLSDQPEGLDVRRRDRYSALLLAAHAARQVAGHGHERGYGSVFGGTPQSILNNAPARRGGYSPMRRKGGVVY